MVVKCESLTLNLNTRISFQDHKHRFTVKNVVFTTQSVFVLLTYTVFIGYIIIYQIYRMIYCEFESYLNDEKNIR